MASGIEWLDWPGRVGVQWNPFIGCHPCLPGCKNCWARREEDGRHRHRGRCNRPDDVLVPHISHSGREQMIVSPELPYFWRGPVYQGDKVLEAPLHWRDPRIVFVCGRSDFFHPDIPDSKREVALGIIARSLQHVFLILTKRPLEVARHIGNLDCAWPESVLNEFGYDGPWPLPNLGLGITVCNQDEADEKIPLLLQCPAAFRYVSFEPMLGPVDLRKFIGGPGLLVREEDGPTCEKCGLLWQENNDERHKCPPGFGPSLDWVIVGGESGKDARPMHPDWARGVRDQCLAAGVPFFFKQFGEFAPCDHFPGLKKPGAVVQLGDGDPAHGGAMMTRVGKKKAGHLLDGREWNELPKIAEAGG